MPDFTDNHELQLFASGETDWTHSPDMNVLEQAVSLKRARAPDTAQETPHSGSLFLNTSTGEIYEGDGTAWTLKWDLSEIGSSGSGIGGHHSETGDGTTQTFSWGTGVSESSSLNYVTIDASTSAASADYERFIDGTSIGVTYAEPPADGESLGWFWSVNASVETVAGEIDAYDGSGTHIGSYSEFQTGNNLTGTVSNGRLTLDASGSGGDHGGDDIGTYESPVSSITNQHYREITNEASVSGDYTVNLANANVHVLTLTGDTSISFTGDHADLTTGCTLIIQQDSTGGHSLDFFEDIYWPSGSEPSLATTAGIRHKLVIENVAGGWEGGIVGEDYVLVSITRVDDFEWGGPVSNRYSGETTAYDIGDTYPTVEGNYALHGVVQSGGNRDEIISQEGDGLDNYPTQGDEFGAWIRSTTTSDLRTGYLFGTQSTDDYYIARIVFDSTNGSEIEIATREAGTFASKETAAVSVSANTWYDLQTHWETDDTLTVTLYDDTSTNLGSVSWTDTSGLFSGETGFGFYIFENTVDGEAYFDDARRL